MAFSLRLNEEETKLIRQSVIERIEDEYDLQVYHKAIAEYQSNPLSYTHEEVKKMLEMES